MLESENSSATSKSKVLFIDDQVDVVRALTTSLIRNGAEFNFLTATSEEEALRLFKNNQPEVCILDLNLDSTRGPKSGLELLSKFTLSNLKTKVLILTGHGEEQYGLLALQNGASSFLTKPIEVLHLKALIEDSLNFLALKKRNCELEEQLISSIPAIGFSTKSSTMKHVLGELRFAASTPQPLLLLGETGTGKGLMANAIHQLSTPNRPFIRAQPSYGNFDLVQSELFGHEKGAFTGAFGERKGLLEEADCGTLFLDEIDGLPNETQVMLLHAVQEGEFRRVGGSKGKKSKFRLIAASNKNLEELKKTIRADLYHRLSHQLITIPPLRQRLEDVNSLSLQIAQEISSKAKLPISSISASALLKLRSHSWPGNIRELKAVVEQAVYRARFAERLIVEPVDLSFSDVVNNTVNPAHFRTQVDQFEKSLLIDALNQSNGNLSQASRRLGLERSQFKRMLHRFSLQKPEG
jgi:DNA-binding NtrC family response regulator